MSSRRAREPISNRQSQTSRAKIASQDNVNACGIQGAQRSEEVLGYSRKIISRRNGL
jgi:hypothetical protein